MDQKNVYSTQSLRAALAMQRQAGIKEAVFCTQDNLEESLSTLSEELESFGIESVEKSNEELQSVETLRTVSVELVNASWKLIHKHRSLMKLHNDLNDYHHRISNDNTNLKNHVKRLKEELQKKQHVLSQVQERERRLKLECQNVSRDLKHEKDEVQKLRKQSHSKDVQHEHELRRIIQHDRKLQERLQKSIGTYVPRDKALQKLQAEHEKETSLYKQTICRLEDNNRLMLQEITDLKDMLALHSTAVDLQIEASGVWTDTET